MGNLIIGILNLITGVTCIYTNEKTLATINLFFAIANIGAFIVGGA